MVTLGLAGQGRGGHVHHFICYLSVFVCQGLNARGNIEVWLGKVEEVMFIIIFVICQCLCVRV